MPNRMRVGIFVLIGLGLVGFIIFMIGSTRRFWESKITYVASFNDVAGLKSGAPIRMGGVDIGTVGRVGHSDNIGDTHVYVELAIAETESKRIREDTVARIVNKGLLGDKMVELTLSVSEAPPLDPTRPLKTEETMDLSHYMTRVDAIAQKTEMVIGHIESATRAFSDGQITEDLKKTTEHVREIMEALAHHDSPLHRLIFDDKQAKQVSRTLTSLEESTGQLRVMLANLNEISKKIQKGTGFVHKLLDDGELSLHIANSLSALEQNLKAVQDNKEGLAHALIYGDERIGRWLQDMTAMTSDLQVIVRDIKAGKGTLGGLLMDPTIYEDVKRTVGTVESNEILRAFVRYSIQADESTRTNP
ncbi:MlaD family protein [Pajaroellobacter abortibovis]|uniref:Mce/MlaD domain-containing protein n=1 Tax=Pajaroellobacter abortibovis TaxID=1882918 RepID=A0A1L6MVF5_9BACT|nr:MlaD family protein [Pajaroellobacter abortibovis]APR99512.1 hypothetical protein BCY86_01550 [Pajaroellobacter abortibovis]